MKNYWKNVVGIYDFGNFIIDRLNELERSDYRIIREYEVKRISESKAKYSAYIGFGGSIDWKSWDDASKNYLNFKVLSSDRKSVV